jgi:alkylation response protein AidB-like acyl-CoA dehydrogenase
MDLRFSAADEAFRREVREWLHDNLEGEFKEARGLGGPGREHEGFELRRAWERRLGEAGWIGLGWPTEHGGRGASLVQQVIFAEEYARARAPARVNHMGENLLGPTLIAFGTRQQRERFLPPILRGEELWCQGYSEPDAGSDLANVATRARLEGDEWVIDGQKVWTSLAQWADWCFVLCRTDPHARPKHKGLSFLLVPMRQPGIEVRPIVQMSGGSEFNEVFFAGARTAEENVVGAVNGGWRVATALLGFERGVSTLGQQVGFERELEEVIVLARSTGRLADPLVRLRLVDAWVGLRIMRWNALRTMSADVPGPEASISKLFWSTWHQRLGELAADICGVGLDLPSREPLRRLFLFSRADTIYAGSSEIQRNVLAERVLGLPREPVGGPR